MPRYKFFQGELLVCFGNNGKFNMHDKADDRLRYSYYWPILHPHRNVTTVNVLM